MAGTLTLQQLQEAMASKAAALRSRQHLQPAGGEGDKVFPPTYAGGSYAMEKRRLPGKDEPVDCVLIDSVQSQANRMEEALQDAVDAGDLKLPVVEVDFTAYEDHSQPAELRLIEPVGKISALQAPHRIADAILRDSVLDGTLFRRTEDGRLLDHASLQNATPLYKLSPTSLLFGIWDSTGPKGGLGAKFERAIVSEIVGIDAVPGVKTSSRIDPLGIQKSAGPVYRGPDNGWTLDANDAVKEKGKVVKRGKDGAPSELNHGNVVPTIEESGGVTISHAEQTTVISLPALRRLRFPVNGGYDRERDVAGRTVLAALGLVAATMANDSGLDLRSRCVLYSEEPMEWELVSSGANTAFRMEAEEAIDLYNHAVTEAEKHDLLFREEPLVLAPSESLVKLVVRSQKLAAEQGSDDTGA